MRKYLLLAAAGGLAMMSVSANAAVTIVATSYDTSDIATPNGPDSSITFGDAGVAPIFSEFITFNNTLAGIYNIDANSSSPFTTFRQVFLTPGAYLPAYATFTSSAPAGATTIPILISDGTEYAARTNLALNPGTYTLTTNGTVSMDGANQPPGSAGGSIAVRLAQTPGPVPEPATWAMMLIGFGGVGFGLRRRKGEGKARVRVTYA